MEPEDMRFSRSDFEAYNAARCQQMQDDNFMTILNLREEQAAIKNISSHSLITILDALMEQCDKEAKVCFESGRMFGEISATSKRLAYLNIRAIVLNMTNTTTL